MAGCGIAQLPTWLIKQQLAEGSLVEVLPHLASEGLAIQPGVAQKAVMGLMPKVNGAAGCRRWLARDL
jgi:DNA-binding transcriptional LysR family regulator